MIITAFILGLAIGQIIGLFVGWELRCAPMIDMDTTQMGQRSSGFHKPGQPGAAPGSAIGT